MGAKQVYFALYAALDDEGDTMYFALDEEALVGSHDGHVWDDAEVAWSDDEPENNAYALLGPAIAVLNENINGQPLVGLDDVIDSFLLAMHAEGLDHDTKARIVTTVRDAIDNAS